MSDIPEEHPTVITGEHTIIVKDPGSPRLRTLRTLREIGMITIVLMALIVTLSTRHDNNNLSKQLAVVQAVNRAIDVTAAEKLNCVRRFQDNVDQGQTDLLIAEAKLVVALSNPTDPNRQKNIDIQIAEINSASIDASDASSAKKAYNRNGSPLPCPLP